MNIDIVEPDTRSRLPYILAMRIFFSFTNIQSNIISHPVKPEADGVLVTRTLLLQVLPLPCAA